MRIAVYIDGFSFYYACFSGPTKSPFTGLKWVDFERLAKNLFPDEDIASVHYFTAIAPNPPDDPGQADRHANYLDALRAYTAVTVHVGRFVKTKREVALVRCPEGMSAQQTAFVWQEKKSDVALATTLIIDAIQGNADGLVLVTNDSDFVPAVQAAKQVSGRMIGIVSPDLSVSKELAKAADFAWQFDKGLLSVSQLPNPVVTPQGKAIHKPARWEREPSE